MNISRELKLAAESQFKFIKAKGGFEAEFIDCSESCKVEFYHKTMRCKGVFVEGRLVEIHWETPKLSGKIKKGFK